MRDEAGLIDALVYARLKSVQLLVPKGARKLEREYMHVSNQ